MSSDGVGVTNNLFADLGPLIALFGDQVSKQFLSQSLGLIDCVLFAMAPLGIITGVVSAIRVSGYTWLRAIVGRAVETRGAAGLELTSATSANICELWDGQSVVRILGTPTILTVVYLDPNDPVNSKSLPDANFSDRDFLLEAEPDIRTTFTNSDARVLGFEEAKIMEWLTKRGQYNVGQQSSARLPSNLRAQSVEQPEEMRAPRSEQPPPRPIPIPPIPPNIALNIRRRPSRTLLQLAASVAVILQALVLVVGGLLAYDNLISGQTLSTTYAFPMLITGTITVCLGLFLCASIVNMSSKKEYWQMSRDRRKPIVHLVWLQKRQTVNDQSFPSFAIRPSQSELLVSYADENFVHVHHQRVLYGVILSLVGFIIQFVGLRNIHWAASVAQLVAMICTTGIRVSVQMPFAKAPDCKELSKNFELEWMTYEIHNMQRWWPQVVPINLRGMVQKETKSHSELVLGSRISLGQMAHNLGWESKYREDAILIKIAIEGFLNALWSGAARLERQGAQLRELKCAFDMGGALHRDTIWSKDCFHLTAERQKHAGGWTKWSADLGEIEALISLWLYQIQLDKADSKNATKCKKEEDEEDDHDEDQVIDQFIWLMSPLSASSCLEFDYWIRRSNHAFRAENKPSTSSIVEYDGIWGMRSPQCEQLLNPTPVVGPHNTTFILAVMTNSTLPRMCGRYLLASFARSALQYVSSILGSTKIQREVSVSSSDEIAFRNTTIDSLADAINHTNLLNTQDALAILIPALKERQLLPPWHSPLPESISTPASFHAQLRIASVLSHSICSAGAEVVHEHVEHDSAENDETPLVTFTKILQRSNAVRKVCTQLLIRKREVQSSNSSALPKHSSHTPTQYEDQSHQGMLFLEELDEFYRNTPSALRLDGEFLWPFAVRCLNTSDESPSSLGHPETVLSYTAAVSDPLSKGDSPFFDEKILWKLAMLLSYRPGVDTLRRLLNEAVHGGRFVAVLMILLETMNDPNTKRIRSNLHQQLCDSAYHQSNQILDVLLFYAQRPITIIESNRNPLLSAYEARNIQAIKLILSSGMSSESRGPDGSTVLQTAVKDSQRDIVEALVDNGAVIDAPVACDNMSALSIAASNDDEYLVDLLLKRGCDPNPPYRPYGTPLQVAAKRSLPIVIRLVEAGADINYPAPPHGLTALQTAVNAKKVSIVTYLAKHRADPFSLGSSCQSPLRMAMTAGHAEIADILRAAMGAGSNLVETPKIFVTTPARRTTTTPNTQTPEPLYPFSATQTEVWDFLPWTALQTAAKAGDEVKVAALLEHEDVNAPATLLNGRTALQAASEHGHDAIVAMLLRFSDVNAERAEIGGLSALEAASAGGHLAVVRRLLDAGAAINTKAGVESGTPLQLACLEGHVEIVRLFLERGAATDEKPAEFRGFTAMEGAITGGCEKVVELLKEYGAAEETEDVPQGK